MINDLKFALRTLGKARGFTTIAVLTLALGIGANTAIFSVVNAVLLQPLPYRAPHELITIWGTNAKDDIPQETASYPDFADWKQQAQSFAAMAGCTNAAVTLTGTEGEPERVPAGLAVGDLFSLLGVEPVMGRKFLAEENQEAKSRVAILSDAFWRRRFGGDPQIIGRQITINANQYTVVGVLPSGFEDPIPGEGNQTQLWLPLEVTSRMQQARRSDFLTVIGRLKPGISLRQATTELNGIASRLENQYPETNRGWRIKLEPLHQTITGDVRPALFVLLGAVTFLLLIGCANVANLMLARGSARQREIAIRAALGASRAQIIRQLLTENVVLALIGGGCGLLLAFWGVGALLALTPANLPRISLVGLDRNVLLFTTGLSLATGLLFGLAPALTLSRPLLNDALKSGGRGAFETQRGRKLRNSLAVAEIALSFILLVGAGLLVRSFMRLQEVNPGFSPDHVLTVQLSLPRAKYAENQQLVHFYEQLLTRLSQQSGIEAVGLTTTLPLTGSGDIWAFSVEGKARPPTDRTPDAEPRIVSAEYFRVLHIPLRRGRLLDDRDAQGTPDVVVINEALAKKYFGNEDPLGKRITFGNPQAADAEWFTVVGIVGDVRQRTLSSEPYPQVYGSFRQSPRRAMTLVLRTRVEPLTVTSLVRKELNAIDPEQPLYNLRTLEQVMVQSIAGPRFNMILIALLASIAVVLAGIGIYGVISYAVTQRTHEIGVRIALGATSANVLRLIVGQAMLLAGSGLLIGVIVAAALTRTMSSLLYGITATDPMTFVSLGLLLASIALLASYAPAARAARVDPVWALRYE